MSAPSDLFPESSPRLSWLPGETLFSLCSRHHALWGHPTSQRTSFLLFGGVRAGTQHDFPSHLDQLARRTAGQWGDVAELAAQRTLLRFYAPFLDAQVHEHAIDAMRGPSVAHLKFRLGILTSRFRAHHPLKACPECMHDDRKRHGWAYWHCDHQFPGVWVCPTHGAPLLESQVKSTGVERFQWHLPDEEVLRSTQAWTVTDVLPELTGLASFICAAVQCGRPIGWMREARIDLLVSDAFEQRGWFTSTGNLRVSTAARSYLGHCSRLEGPDELRAFPRSLSVAKAQLARLRRSIVEGTHPLRLLVALHWLFGGFESFVRELDACSGSLDHPAKPEVPMQPRACHLDEVRSRVVDAMRAGQSARAAAARFGVAVATAMAWAADAGLCIARRPKILTESVLGAIKADLTLGHDKVEIAKRVGLSVETITRVLRSEVGLQSVWRRARWVRAQDRARNSWTGLIRDHPGLGVKLLRALDPSAYAWLYRHDRAWLKGHTPDRQIVVASRRHSSVDWMERDRTLKDGVERAVLELSRTAPGRKLRLWEIYQVFPDLKPKLRVLHRLPLTREALERTLGRAMPCKGDSLLFP